MGFRNPVRSLPATSITGQITGPQIAAGAIDGKLITGATIRTSAGFPRIELAPDGNLYFYTAADQDPGMIRVSGEDGTLQLIGPDGQGVEYGLTFQNAFGTTTATLDTEQVYVVGSLFADNIRSGRASITPSAANTPTSLTITGVGMSGSGPVRALVTASSTVPGTSVTGVGATSPNRDGVTLWIARTNTAATFVEYLLIGE